MAYTNVKETFEKMPSVFQAAKAKGMNSVIQYVFDGEGGGKWVIEIKDGSCQTREGTHDSPNVTITMSVETWLSLVNEELSGMQAFMGGKLKVTGDTGLAQKVSILFPL
jgi:putative sterol carrier protein